MDTPSISTTVIAVCTGLALLTPLVKAVSQWHIALRKTSKGDKAATTRQSQTFAASQTEESPWYRRIGFSGWTVLLGSLCTAAMSFLGIYILHRLSNSSDPLTSGIAAQIITGAVFITIGFLKEWKH